MEIPLRCDALECTRRVEGSSQNESNETSRLIVSDCILSDDSSRIRHPKDGLRGLGLDFLRVDVETWCDCLEKSSVFDCVWALPPDHSGDRLSVEFSRRLERSSSNESTDNVRISVDSMILSNELSRF
jgi:hypothetical protein